MFEDDRLRDLAVARQKLAADDLDVLPTATLADRQVALRKQLDALEAEYLRGVSVLDHRCPLDDLGFPTATSLLAHRCGVTAGEAAASVRLARNLEHMPGTRAALADGRISTTQARVLATAFMTSAVMFERDEALLVSQATQLTAGDLAVATRTWRQLADAEDARVLDDKQLSQRALYLSTTVDDMGRFDGWFTPEGTETVSTAIRSIAEQLLPDDPRTPAQRRHDALVDICRDYLNRGDTPIQGGERPHVSALVDLETLEGRFGRRAAFESGTPISGEQARRMACDAGIARIITRGDSEPLDLGRLTRTVPSSLRRGVVARDRHCTFPGCRRPARWCDAHHIVFWANGGPTSLPNLTLLCSYHHHLVHEGGWRVHRDSTGHLAFTHPDGTSVPDRGPP